MFFARFDGEVLPILSVPGFYNVLSFNLVRFGRNKSMISLQAGTGSLD